jgi:hypothetical protein
MQNALGRHAVEGKTHVLIHSQMLKSCYCPEHLMLRTQEWTKQSKIPTPKGFFLHKGLGFLLTDLQTA